jgi:hypothetical protein
MADISKKIPSVSEPAQNEAAAGPETKKLVQEKKDVWERARREAELAGRMESKREMLPAEQERDVVKQLRKEIEEMELEPSLRAEAEKKAKKIEFLGEKEKLEHLMDIANKKGIEYAVKVAKSMGDPYILDLFHDLLVKEGFYRNFLNQVAQSSTQTPPPSSTPTPPPQKPQK